MLGTNFLVPIELTIKAGNNGIEVELPQFRYCLL